MRETSPGVFQFDTDRRFWNQIGPFGGWLAATAMRAMSTQVDPAFVVRSFNAHFLGAIQPGELTVRVKQLRAQRTIVGLLAELSQDGQIGVSAQALFGRDRAGPRHSYPPPPAMQPPDAYPRWRGLEAFARFTQAFDYRLANGMPLRQAGSFDSSGYLRLEDCEAPGPAELLLLADAWFPAPWAGLPEPTPVSTLSLSVLFHHAWDPRKHRSDGFLAVRRRTLELSDGYADDHGELWLPDGSLALQCQQLIWINFAKGHQLNGG